jgi:two-component system response regulator AtoC
MQILHLFDNKDVIRNQSVFLIRTPEIGLPLATPRTVEIQVLERNACHVARESGSPHSVVISGEIISPDSGDQAFVNLVSPSAQPLERIINEIAPTDIPVLIIGESGSGKEVIARRLHRLSHRSDEPFVRLTCGRLSPKDLDQLLGGRKPVGILKRLSDAGTVFLDEVCDLEGACQPKLLHLFPDGDTGSHDPCLRARIISSTSQNIEEQTRCGCFREELYYRLTGVCLRLPPLRHRKEDIPVLVDFFLGKYAKQFGRPKPMFSTKVLGRFLDYPWPGNIRQLENVVRNIVALGDERLALGNPELLSADPGFRGAATRRFSLKEAARAASHQAERQLILQALDRTHWNRKQAARELQISYKAFLYKVKQIGMEESAGPARPKGQAL